MMMLHLAELVGQVSNWAFLLMTLATSLQELWGSLSCEIYPDWKSENRPFIVSRLQGAYWEKCAHSFLSEYWDG